VSEENKAISRRWLEDLFNAGNLNVADEIVAPEHTNHDPTVPDFPSGPEGLKRVAGLYRDAFPDALFTVEDQIDDGDKVVTRWSVRGTHRGGFLGFYPTGSRVKMTGITIDRISGGKLVESWSNYDALGIMQQIGAGPLPEQAAP
jgi:predicted ester cyclase